MGKSAHRELQDARQEGYDLGTTDTKDGVRKWLEERAESEAFRVVLEAFDADWLGEERTVE